MVACKETKRISVDPEEIKEYWSQLAAALGRDPVGAAEGMVPLGWWGDDARYNKQNDKITLFTMNVLHHNPQRF